MEHWRAMGVTKRFDGASEDAARRCWKWRPWADTYLTLLQGRGTASETRGAARFCLLDELTQMALEEAPVSRTSSMCHTGLT